MSRTPLLAALALATALAPAVPAAATPRAPHPHLPTPAATPGPAHQTLAWLAALWGGGSERATTAREASGAAIDTSSLISASPPSRPIRFPSGGGIDPNG